MKKILFLSIAAGILSSCASTPDFSGRTNSQLISDYHKTLMDLRYQQGSYNPDRERTNPYNTSRITTLKERLSLLRDEILSRGVSLP